MGPEDSQKAPARGRGRRRLAAACLAFAGLAALAAPAQESTEPAPQPGVEVRGRVWGAQDRFVPGATVWVKASTFEAERPDAGDETSERPTVPPREAAEATTDERGFFSIRRLEGSRFAVLVAAPGFAAKCARDVPSNSTLDVRLKPGRDVTGHVLEATGAAPVAGATVRACRHDALLFGDRACVEATTGEDGAFSVGPLGAGRIRLTAWGPSHAREERWLDVPAGEEAAVAETSFSLAAGGTLAGSVVDRTGRPLDGVRVDLEETGGTLDDDEPRRTASTDDEGQFRFEGVLAGRNYRVRARKEGWPVSSAGPFEVVRGASRDDVVVTLSPGATLRLRLLDPDDRPFDGHAAVRLVESDGGGAAGLLGGLTGYVREDRLRQDGDGWITVTRLESGTYDLQVVADGYKPTRGARVRLRPGEQTVVDPIILEQGLAIAGVVTSVRGEPLEGATVEALQTADRGGGGRSTTTDDGGAWEIAGLEEGPILYVTATAEGFARGLRNGVEPGDRAVDFALERNGRIVGRVLAPGNASPDGFRVFAHTEAAESQPLQFNRPQLGRALADGAFEIDGLAPGTYTVEIRARGSAPATRSGVVVESGAEVDAGTLRLERGIEVRGRVVSAADGAPVGGASVRIVSGAGVLGTEATYGDGVTTGVDGRFRLEGLSPGRRRLAAGHPDFAPAEVEVEVSDDAGPNEITLRLGQGGVLTGTVRDRDGMPGAGEEIVAYRSLTNFADARRARTDASGRYEMRRLPAGSYQVLRMGAGDPFGSKPRGATIRDGEVTVVDFGDEERIRLSGRVLRGAEPVHNALLLFSAADGLAAGQMQSTATDADGNYRIGLDAPGAYQVMAQDGARPVQSGVSPTTIVVPDEPDVLMDIAFGEGSIAGTAIDEEGTPVSGAMVAATAPGARAGDAVAAQTTSGENGSWTIGSVEDGVYELRALAPGFRAWAGPTVEVSGGAAIEGVEVRLSRGSAIRGRLVDPAGAGLPNALVFASPAGSSDGFGSFPGQTDVNGRFRVVSPEEGLVEIVAIARGWAPARATVSAPAGDGVDEAVTLVASRGGRLRIRVLDGAERPVEGARVRVRADPPSAGLDWALAISAPQPTDSSGDTLVEGLVTGAYDVSIAGRDDVPAVAVPVHDGAEAATTLRIP